MYNQEKIIEKAKKVHGNKYDYSKVVYNKLIDKVTIICPIHGEFHQSMHCHINKKQGCPKCCVNERTKSRTDTLKIFIDKAKKIHGDKYDYSKVEYEKSDKKVCIICPEHGEFWQKPGCHISNKEGCPECAKINRKVKNIPFEEFLKRSNEKHKNKYDYSKVKYEKTDDYITIICPKHGEFIQKVCSHMNGSGCKKCANELVSKRQFKTTDDFVKQATIVHGDKYDYSKVEYNGIFEPITIICKKHGEFKQIASNHLQGNGCQKCGIIESKGENEIYEYIKELIPNEKILHNDRKTIKGIELDIYVPNKQIAFEFDGLYWHSELYKDKDYHVNKTNECEKNNIQLIHIFEDEWNDKKEICKSRIKNILGLTKQKIYARKCIIKEIDSKISKDFLEKNHIQGNVNSKIRIGLYYNDELVSLMTFGKKRINLGNKNVNNEYEMIRFCNKINYSIIGGASKLLNYFIKSYNPDNVITYADRRWSNGNLYEKIGFKLNHISNPSYFYMKELKRINRFSMRKDILVSKYGCKPEETEHSFCFNNKYYRIYDCGTKVFTLF